MSERKELVRLGAQAKIAELRTSIETAEAEITRLEADYTTMPRRARAAKPQHWSQTPEGRRKLRRTAKKMWATRRAAAETK